MAKLTTQAIDIAKREAVAAMRRADNFTLDAYVCRWGNAGYANFFFAGSPEAAEDYRSRAAKAEGKKLTIVAVVRREEGRMPECS